MPNPPLANPLVAERALRERECWGLTGVSEVHGKLQESVGISNRLLTHATPRFVDRQGSLSATPGLANPKDPAVLKILRVVNLLRVLFLVQRGDLLSRRVLCGHHFPGNYRHFCSQRRARGVLNLGGVVKTLRRSNSLYLLSS